MITRWSFLAFDWAGFRIAEAALEYSCSTGDFTTLEMDEAAEILERFDTEADPAVISNTLVAELFGGGEAVIFESGLLETIREIRKRPNGEPLAEILSELLTAEPNVEPWFRADEGLVGILTEAQTRALHETSLAFRPGYTSSRPRGVAVIGRIFSPSDKAGDRLSDLLELAAQAAAENKGIGVIREG